LRIFLLSLCHPYSPRPHQHCDHPLVPPAFLRDGYLNPMEKRCDPVLGYVFDVRWLLPVESIVSILWKFARAGGLPGHVLGHLIGADSLLHLGRGAVVSETSRKRAFPSWSDFD
jgi:hypothetical protein